MFDRFDSFVAIVSVLFSVLDPVTPCSRLCNEVNLFIWVSENVNVMVPFC